MMWPMRRASFGRAKNCSPASCVPANTSQSRNSALSLPSLEPMRPTTRACALTTRQSSKRGTLSVPTPFSMKAAWSMGMNRPEARKSFATTSEISRAVSGATDPSPAKSAMAMGSGWMVPCVMLSSTTARAGVEADSAPSPKRTSARRHRLRLRIGSAERVMSVFASRGSSAGAIHIAWVEIEDHVAPERIFVAWQRIGLALVDGSHCAVGSRLKEGRGAAIGHGRIADQRPILVELEPQFHHDLLGAQAPRRRAPALGDAGSERIDLIDRHGHLRAVRLPVHLLARRLVGRQDGVRLIRRVGNLVEQRGDPVGIEVAFFRRRRRLTLLQRGGGFLR